MIEASDLGAWDDGVSARAAGRAIALCPHPASSGARTRWIEGWRAEDARLAAEARRRREEQRQAERLAADTDEREWRARQVARLQQLLGL